MNVIRVQKTFSAPFKLPIHKKIKETGRIFAENVKKKTQLNEEGPLQNFWLRKSGMFFFDSEGMRQVSDI